MRRHLALPVCIVETALIFATATCFAQRTNQTTGQDTTASNRSARKPVIADLKPTIDNGQANRALISTRRVDDKDWLVFSLKKGSHYLYCGSAWILPGTPSGGEWTDANGDHFLYGAEGTAINSHIQLSPGAVAIDNDNAPYRGLLDFNGSEYTFVGNVNLLGVAFSSNNNSPLTFKLVKGVGAVYVSGKGTVTLQDGKKLIYP